jgi:hypothetical protein
MAASTAPSPGLKPACASLFSGSKDARDQIRSALQRGCWLLSGRSDCDQKGVTLAGGLNRAAITCDQEQVSIGCRDQSARMVIGHRANSSMARIADCR